MDSQSNETSYDLGPLNGLADDPDFINNFLNNFDPEKDESLRTPEFEAIMQSPPVVEQLITILAQPQCSGKLRYRSSYSENSTRREPLKGSSTTYTGPAIYIRQDYLNFNRDKYVGVCLSTVKHEKTNSLYIHPYILENIDNKTQNDTKNNIVWYPLSNLTQNSILNFPDLRIVRVTEGDLESDGNLRVFHDYNSSATLSTANPIVVSKRQIKREYNLTKGQLAFFIGEKQNSLDEFPIMIPTTTISLSEQFDLRTEDGTNEDTESSASPPTPTDCSIYKYAPLFGFTEGDTEMIVICTKNLNKRQYGDVKIRFQSDIDQLNELEFKSIKIESNILYFKMPSLPFPIRESLDVKIKIEQTKRDLGVINYQYLNKNECMTCQMNKSKAANLLTRSNSNKRLRHCTDFRDTEYDGVVPDSERDHTPTLRHSQSEQLPNQSSSNNDEVIDTLNRLEDSIHQLFQNNDLKPVLRTSRLFIIQRPELFYEAIEKNYSDLITSFVSVAGQKLLEHRNNQGDTPFLYGIRLNRVTFIQAFLKRQDINEYIYDVNFRGQNIFHLVAMNNDSNELFELIINYLDRNSIDIKKKFDCIDADKQTPLQIAILKHNFSAIRHLIKYSDKEIVQTSDTLGENLIHFTVRYGDLMILKYLLENEDLIEQGNRSSLTMTPYELASSLNHDDMKEYLEKIYPQPKLECEEETSDNQ